MKNLTFICLAFVVTMLSSCQVIGGIFKAGFATAIILVLVVVLLVIWLISAFRGKN